MESRFARPRKIDNSNKTREIVLKVSEDEYELFRSYAEGRSIEAMSRAWQCNKSTIISALRDIARPAFGMKADYQKERRGCKESIKAIH